MRIPTEILLRGVARTLLEEVLPHLEHRPARGQLYAAVDVLRNVARRLEPAAAPLETEARSAEEALRAAAARLAAPGGAPALAARIDAELSAWPAAPPIARAEAARTTLRALFPAFAALEAPLADAVRSLVAGHLAAQAVRDVSLLEPSLLEEISRG